MINTDDVIKKIQHQATLALQETSENKKEGYLYSIQALTELVLEGKSTPGLTSASPGATKISSHVDASELKMMMGNMDQASTKAKTQVDETTEDRFEQGSGSLLDF